MLVQQAIINNNNNNKAVVADQSSKTKCSSASLFKVDMTEAAQELSKCRMKAT
jgi:hypothetical protein